ncbi:MAG: hypothetical protein AAFN12_06015, partial [Cyanobacteria bacterium J06560_2]
VHLSQQDFENAEKDFTRVIEINDAAGKPQSIAVYEGRGAARGRLKDKPGAIADMTEAIALDPKAALNYKFRGLLYLNSDNEAAALKDLQKARELYKAEGIEDDQVELVLASLE